VRFPRNVVVWSFRTLRWLRWHFRALGTEFSTIQLLTSTLLRSLYTGRKNASTRYCVLCSVIRRLSREEIETQYYSLHAINDVVGGDTSIVCMTSAADAEDVNISMPFHICWNTSDVISCVITRDEYTYRPEPVVTGLSRMTSSAK